MAKSKITIKVWYFFSVLLFLGCNNTKNERKTADGPMALTNWETFTGTLPDDFSHKKINVKDVADPAKWKPISSYQEIAHHPNNKYIGLRTRLPRYQIGSNSVFLTHSSRYARVYVNNDFICEIGDTVSFSMDISVSRLLNMIKIPCYKQGDFFTLFILADNPSNEYISGVLLSSSKEIIIGLFKSCMSDIFFSIIFLFSGIVFLILNAGSLKSKLFSGIALLLIAQAVFVASNSPIYKFIFNIREFFYHADYISFMSASTSAVFAIEQSIAIKYKKIVKFFWQAHLGFLICSTLIINFGITTYFAIIPFFLSFVIITMFVCVVIMILSTRKGIYESKLLIIGMAGLMICAFPEIYIYLSSTLPAKLEYQVNFIHFGTFWLVFTLVLIGVYRNKKAQQEKEDLRQKEKEAVLRESETKEKFTRELIKSQENERNRIALELHDSVGQKLLLIKNQLLSKIKHEEDQRFCESLVKICDITGDTIQDIREISRNLRPQHLDQLGLKTAIETLVEFIQDSSSITIHFDIDDIDGWILHEHEISFYRIIQESLNNIVKHSKASQAYIHIKRNNGYIDLSVEDNGTGIKETQNGTNKGFGLIGMQQRAKMMGGELQFEKAEKGGMIILLKYKEKEKQQHG